MQGTRFEHSLGVMHIAGKILEELCREENYAGGRNLARDLFRQATRDYRVWIANRLPRKSELYRVLRLAALVHDIGHLPYSHTSEAAFERFLHGAIPSLNMRFHEIVGLEVLRQTRIINDLAVERGVLLVLLSDTEMGRTIGLDRTVFRLLKEIISGEVDADRADYLLRDGLNSGTGFGDYDIDRFVGSLRLAFIGEDLHTLADMRGLSSVESALLERYKLYKYVLWHHKVLLYDELAGRVIRAMFAEPSLAQTFFRHYRGRMTVYQKDLRRRIRSPLGRGGGLGSTPPFVLFRGDVIGRGRGYFELNVRALTNTPRGYFDDVWLVGMLRALVQPRVRHARPHPIDISLDALVERRECDIVLWKDYAEFIAVMGGIAVLAVANERLQRIVEPRIIEAEQAKTMFGTIRRNAEQPDPLWRSLEQELYLMIEERMTDRRRGTFGVLRKPGARFFGNMRDIHLVRRDGVVVNGVDVSPVLYRLDRLPNEVPIYAYVILPAGKASSVKTSAGRSRLMRRFQKSVVESLAELGEKPEYKVQVEQLLAEV
jgi:hypothetical protein